MRLSSSVHALAAISSLTSVVTCDVIATVMETKVEMVAVHTVLVTVGWEHGHEALPAATTTSTTTSTTTVQTAIQTSSPSTTSSIAPAIAMASSASNPSSSFADAILNSTNWFRSHYEAAPLAWDDTLADFAKSHAETCVFAHSGGPYGENIAAAWPILNAMDGVDDWGNEEAEYNWGNPGFTETTGHFTQLVWQATTSVGCGLVSCHNSNGINNGDFLVCEYSPAGNVLTEFAQNVRKAGLSKKGEPGLGSAGRSFGVSRFLAALVVVYLLVSLFV